MGVFYSCSIVMLELLSKNSGVYLELTFFCLNILI